jgi:hypothetical protein
VIGEDKNDKEKKRRMIKKSEEEINKLTNTSEFKGLH